MTEYEHIKDYPIPRGLRRDYYENHGFSWQGLLCGHQSVRRVHMTEVYYENDISKYKLPG